MKLSKEVKAAAITAISTLGIITLMLALITYGYINAIEYANKTLMKECIQYEDK